MCAHTYRCSPLAHVFKCMPRMHVVAWCGHAIDWLIGVIDQYVSWFLA